MKHPIKALPLRVCARLTLSALALSAASTTFAETSETFDTMTVTANRMPTENALAPTTVITRADIERLQINDLPSLLSRFPGIDMTMSGGLGKSSSIFMRGTNSDHVLFLVDGVKWFSATSGGAAIQDFPVSQIERIEIVRGPRSGLYGSEAIGGVIQIFTRQAKSGFTPYGEVSVGSHNAQAVTAGAAGGNASTSYNLTVNHSSTNGINAREENDPDHDGYRNKSVSAKLSHQLTDDWSVGLNFLRAEGDNEYDGFTPTNDHTADTVQQVMGFNSGYQVTDNWSFQFQLSESRDQLEDFTNNISSGVFDTRHRLVSISNLIDIAPGHLLNIGFDYEHDKVTSSNEYSEKSRDNRAPYISWQAEVDRFSWLLSARHDNNEAYGSKNTGTAEAGFYLTDNLQLVANVGTGFKAPTFNQLYWPDQGFFVGNPDLNPEKSKSYGLGLIGSADWGTWSVHSYHTDIRDLLIYQFPTTQNVDEAEIEGVEFDIATAILGWQVSFNAAFLNPEDKETDKTLRRRAQRMANLHVDRQFGKWATGASWKLVGHRYDDAANTDRLGGYGLLDLRLTYQFADDWSAKLSASNVFDKKYQTVPTYNSLDRTVMFTLTYQP
jgi:vitamin B12 transporter